MTYVDGFVIAVPNGKKEAYLQHARECVPVFKKYGALRLVENWGADVPDGELTSFPMAVKLEPDETVVFSWVEWPSKEAREEGMEKIVKDPFFEGDEEFTIFDTKRMIFGSFETILDE